MKHIVNSSLILSFLISHFSFLISYASEGMWLLPNLPDDVIEAMDECGMEFDMDAVYSGKQGSLKDATVYLTSGYTGTIISKKGLVIAPYSAVGNYLPDSIKPDSGYKSPSVFKEIPLGNLSAWILQSAKDVTYQITSKLQGVNDEKTIAHKVDSVSNSICSSMVLPSGHLATISKTSTGAYYLYHYKCFGDVRLAYLPPKGIANDSLRQERHSADFVILRIYADRSNEPAAYDNSNQTYFSNHSAVISRNKYQILDFVTALGYPNKSNRQVLSAEIIENYATRYEAQIKAMQFIDSTGYKSLSQEINAINKSLSSLRGSSVIDGKVKREMAFTNWAANRSDFNQVLRYANLIPKINLKYKERCTYVSQYEIINTISHNVETLSAVDRTLDWNDENEEDVFAALNHYFVNMDASKEKEMLVKVLDYFEANIDSSVTVSLFEVEKSKKYKGNRIKYIDDIFSKSVVTDEKRFLKYLDKPSQEILLSDPLVSLVNKIAQARKYMYALSIADDAEIAKMTRVFNEGYAIYKPALTMAPDANYSLRLSYGKIAGYAQDDVHYVGAVSRLSGVFSHSYLVPKTRVDSVMTSLYETVPSAKKMNITFMTDCDMVTGRMGYGVYDKNGELLGIVTSSNAEALTNTYLYDSDYQRLVVLDMNYVAFVIDKYAKADYIFEELRFGEVEKMVKIKEVEPEKEVEEEAENID